METDNFTVLTDAKELKAVEMVKELENFRHFIARLLGYKQRGIDYKIPIILASNKKHFPL
jgi:hypothetical protein